MKAVLVNGSTNRALEEISKTLDEENVESEIFWIGKKLSEVAWLVINARKLENAF